MLVEANDLGDRNRGVVRRRGGCGCRAADLNAFTPDLVVGVESTGSTLDEARCKQGRQRLTAIDVTVAADYTSRVAVIEGVPQVGARPPPAVAAFRPCTSVGIRVAIPGVPSP